jgi:hypothetical protein
VAPKIERPTVRKELMRRRHSRGKTVGRENARLDLPAIVFDLDGNLVDSNYQHVEAWCDALRSVRVVIPMWDFLSHLKVGAVLFPPLHSQYSKSSDPELHDFCNSRLPLRS